MAKKEIKRINVLGITIANLEAVKEYLTAQGIILIILLTTLLAQAFRIKKWGGKVEGRTFQASETSKTYCKLIAQAHPIKYINAINAVGSTLYGLAAKLSSAESEEEINNIIQDAIETGADTPGPAKILSQNLVKESEENFEIAIRGKIAKSRGLQQSNPIYKQSSLTIGHPIKSLNLELVWESAKIFWEKLFPNSDFEAIFRNEMVAVKERWNSLITSYDPEGVHPMSKLIKVKVPKLNCLELISISLHLQFMEIEGKLTFHTIENGPYESKDRLAPLEQELEFITRTEPTNLIDTIDKAKISNPIIEKARQQLMVGDLEANKTKRVKRSAKLSINPSPDEQEIPDNNAGKKRRRK